MYKGEQYSELRVIQALREIKRLYGVDVSIYESAETLRHFGRNESVGTSEATIQEMLGSELHETFPTSNSIDKIISDDASYTGTVNIHGHTISGSTLTAVEQDVILTGQTAVTLGTPLARAHRMHFNSADTLATDKKIYVYEDTTTTAGVPDTDANVHLILNEDFGISQKCSTSVCSDHYWIITEIYFATLKKQAASVDFKLQMRKVGWNNWETHHSFAGVTAGSPGRFYSPNPCLIVPPNYDVRMTALSSAAGSEVVGGFGGFLAVSMS